MSRSIEELAADLCETERPTGVVISNETVVGLLVAATRFYAGYANLTATGQERTKSEDINAQTALTLSEWAIIRPLYLLYVERETALQLEAARMMGVDPYGRTSSEVASEIQQYEADMPHKCYVEPYQTI